MKGISKITILLMLVIIVGVLGLAYYYYHQSTVREEIVREISTRTAVVLSILPESLCTPSTITVMVRNDGVETSGKVTVNVTSPGGASDSCTIDSINAGQIASCSISRGTKLTGSGYYRVVASTVVANILPSAASITIYCP